MILKAKIQDRGMYIAVGKKISGEKWKQTYHSTSSDQYLPGEEKN